MCDCAERLKIGIHDGMCAEWSVNGTCFEREFNHRQPLKAVLSPLGPASEGRPQAADEQAVRMADPSRPKTCFSVRCLSCGKSRSSAYVSDHKPMLSQPYT